MGKHLSKLISDGLVKTLSNNKTDPIITSETKKEGINVNAQKADIERRRPTSYIENSKNKKSSLETFRNEAKRE